MRKKLSPEEVKTRKKIRHSAYYKKQYSLNKEKFVKNNKKYYENNKEKIIKKTREYQKTRKYKEKRKEFDKEYAKRPEVIIKRRAGRIMNNKLRALRVPKWLTIEQKEKILWFYAEADRLTKLTGIPHQVDHIIPLLGKNISGLHHPDNLQILTKFENISKGNRIK